MQTCSGWNATAAASPRGDAVARAVRDGRREPAPERVAVSCGDGRSPSPSWTGARTAGAAAGGARGGPGRARRRLPRAVDRDSWSRCLRCLKAGAAYVPLDPSVPGRAALAFMLADAERGGRRRSERSGGRRRPVARDDASARRLAGDRGARRDDPPLERRRSGTAGLRDLHVGLDRAGRRASRSAHRAW